MRIGCDPVLGPCGLRSVLPYFVIQPHVQSCRDDNHDRECS
ncbi:hypothetical protein PDIG_05980 [Penicillium digitatum PHI26]|uniref:Uncharacterized protein n=2 Tax=Penicillium digitatum TaxID=36651 RepID=K9H1S4_PEND2|nr:hypothetical protein PDIP_10660 [Penicillium digitatum Pd1]EKV19101.1 hypothetical protein PDIG_05980 [Penicillium digitatum PHI26]EKV21010.1 hypothetical protein PDIP_10660 [Penicillium digitatum Pd1]